MSEQNYPNISVMPRISSSGCAFSVEVRHDDEGDWETYFNGDDREKGLATLDACLLNYPDYTLYIDTHVVQGYLYQIRTEKKTEKFFKPLDKLRNPFYNRKVYENSNEGSTVSFTGYNLT